MNPIPFPKSRIVRMPPPLDPDTVAANVGAGVFMSEFRRAQGQYTSQFQKTPAISDALREMDSVTADLQSARNLVCEGNTILAGIMQRVRPDLAMRISSLALHLSGAIQVLDECYGTGYEEPATDGGDHAA